MDKKKALLLEFEENLDLTCCNGDYCSGGHNEKLENFISKAFDSGFEEGKKEGRQEIMDRTNEMVAKAGGKGVGWITVKEK